MRELEILESAIDGIIEHHSPFMERYCKALDDLVARGLLTLTDKGYYLHRYSVTKEGMAFIAKHAAPAEW